MKGIIAIGAGAVVALAAAMYGGYSLAGGESASPPTSAAVTSAGPSPTGAIAAEPSPKGADAPREVDRRAVSPAASDAPGVMTDHAQVCADRVINRMARYYEVFGSARSERSEEAYRLIIKDLAPRAGTDEFWALAHLSRVGESDAGTAIFPEPGFYIPTVLGDLGPDRMLGAVRSDLVLACRIHRLLSESRLARLWEQSTGCDEQDCTQPSGASAPASTPDPETSPSPQGEPPPPEGAPDPSQAPFSAQAMLDRGR